MFYTTTVTFKRYAHTTPMGVREVVIVSETQADSVEAARAAAERDAMDLTGNLDSIYDVRVEVR